MRETCDNCGQPVLATDTICWHCGQALAAEGAETTESPPPQEAADAKEEKDTAVTLSPTLRLAYGILTVLIFIAMLLVMRSLGKYPLVVVNPEMRAGVEWDTVEGEDGRYTLNLPQSWQRWRPGDPRFQAVLNDDPRYQTALFPLAAIAEDTEYLLLVPTNHHSAAEAPGFLAVARSERLRQVPLPQVIELVQQSPAITIRQAEIGPGLTGRDQVQLELDFARGGDAWRCRQRVAPVAETAFLIGACAMPTDFIRYEERFADVLLSFQPLP